MFRDEAGLCLWVFGICGRVALSVAHPPRLEVAQVMLQRLYSRRRHIVYAY